MSRYDSSPNWGNVVLAVGLMLLGLGLMMLGARPPDEAKQSHANVTTE